MLNLSAAGDVGNAEPPQDAAQVVALQAPPPTGNPRVPRPRAEVQALLPPPAQLRSRVAAFRELLGANRSAIEQAWSERLKGLRPRGIVVAAGGPSLLTNAFVGLFVLRHYLRCSLPIVVMYWGNITADLPTAETIAFMQERIPGLEMVDASQLAYPPWQTPLAETPDQWKGWKLKAFAVYAAPFQEVLFLDSDATPALDPNALFDQPSYRMAGSMFWPDIWCGDVDLFRALRMPSIGPGERQTESGLFLIDRSRHWRVLEWLLLLNVENDVTYKLAYGDKDTFRAAFFLAGRQSDFYQVPLPLGLMLQLEAGAHRMRGFLHAHPNGSCAFLHRVAGSKFDPGQDDPRNISHVTLPSCAYFQHRGWHHAVVPADHFAPGVLRSSLVGEAQGVSGSPAEELPGAPAAPAAASGAGGSGPAGEGCAFDMHTLYDASRRCASYNCYSAGGDQALPLFQIPDWSHVGRVVAESAAAFRLLREEVARRGPSSQLFKASS